VLDRLAKRYLTPENLLRLALQALEQAVLILIDLARNAEVQVGLEGDSYRVTVDDAKDRYSVSVEGEVKEKAVEARVEVEAAGVGVEGEFTVRGRRVAELARRALDELSGG